MTKPARDWQKDWELCQKATPGPWYPRRTDDESFMNARYVSTEPGPGWVYDGKCGMSVEECEPEKVIAITLLQTPECAAVEDGKWDENTEFIAEAREALPYWLQRVKELEGALKLAYKALTEGMKDVPTEAYDPQCAKIRVEAKKAIRKALKRMTENDRARL